MRLRTVVASLVLAGGLGVVWAVPQQISYQGKLLDASGVPVPDGSYSMEFRFYDACVGGVLLLTDTHPAVPVTAGVYGVLLGDGTLTAGVEPDLLSVFAHHDPVCMGVTIGADPEMTPRQRITSSAFALRAAAVDGVPQPARQFASGTGTDGDPYRFTAGTWDADVKGRAISFEPGIYEIGADQTLMLSSNTELLCEKGAEFRWPANRTAVNDMFQVENASTGVRIRGCKFSPGITQPTAGDGQGGKAYIAVGSGGTPSQIEAIIEDSDFGPARFASNLDGQHIHVLSGTRNLRIENNRFDYTCNSIVAKTGSQSNQQFHDNPSITGNVFDFSAALSSSCVRPILMWGDKLAVSPGLWHVVRNLTISDNKFSGNTHRTCVVGMTWENVTIRGNIYTGPGTQYICDVQSHANNPTWGKFVTFANNQYAGGGHGEASVQYGEHAVWVGNSWRQELNDNAITVSNVDHALVVGNMVDESQDNDGNPTAPVSLHNVRFGHFASNTVIDPGDAAFGLTGFMQDVYFADNLLVGTRPGPTAEQFFHWNGTCAANCIAVDNHAVGTSAPTNPWSSEEWTVYSGNRFRTTDEYVEHGGMHGFRLEPIGQGGASGKGYSIQLPASITSNQSLTLPLEGPDQTGSSTNALIADESGQLRWQGTEVFDYTTVYDSGLFSTLDSGDATNPSQAGDQSDLTYATFTQSDGGDYSHHWTLQGGPYSGYPYVWYQVNGVPAVVCSPATLRVLYCSGAGCDPSTGVLIDEQSGTHGGMIDRVKLDAPLVNVTDVTFRVEWNGSNNSGCEGRVYSIGLEESADRIEPARADELSAPAFRVAGPDGPTWTAADGAGPSCTGPCVDGSICSDTDGDGSTSCNAGACTVAFCRNQTWYYPTDGP